MTPTRSGVTCGLGARCPSSGRRTRKAPERIEAAFCRLKDFRRVATPYNKLAANFASAVALATVVAFWC
jgi:transposase